MRALLLALAALSLCACNQVYSRKPLIDEARLSDDPEFHQGLWSITGYEDRCQFEPKKPLRDWPECAVGVEFRRGQMYLVTGHSRAFAQTMRLIAGDPVKEEPILVQGHWRTDVFADPRVPEMKDTDNPVYGWTYAWVTPVRTDGAGRMLEAKLVQGVCGPLPIGARVTNRPFAGLQVVNQNCVAKDLATVKSALAASAELNPPQTLKFVREEP
jgi:hypothetical protein